LSKIKWKTAKKLDRYMTQLLESGYSSKKRGGEVYRARKKKAVRKKAR